MEYVIALRGHTHTFTVPSLDHEYYTSTKVTQKTSEDSPIWEIKTDIAVIMNK